MKHLSPDLKEGISSLSQVDRKLTISFGILILVLMLSVLFTSSFYFKNIMDKEERKLSTLLTQILATSISRVSFSGRYHAQLLLEDTKKEYPDLKYIHVTDLTGRILASSNKKIIGKLHSGNSGTAVNKILMKTVPNYSRKTAYEDEHVIEISLPYRGGFEHTIKGVVQVGISQKGRHQEFINGSILIIVMVVLFLIFGIIIVRKISRHFGNPIQHLASDMEATLLAIPDLLYELDMDGRYIQIMAHQKESLTETREHLLGKTITEILPKDVSTKIHQALQSANDNGESHGQQFSLTLPEGVFWYELSIARKFIKNSDKTHFIVLSRDITQRKKIEEELNAHKLHLEKLVQDRTIDLETARNEAQEANKAKSLFLSNMSHELRTPLNAILGFGQMLELDANSLTQLQNSNVQEILNAGDHLLKLINEVLDLAKIESGKSDLTIKSVAIVDLLQQCISLVSPQLIKHQLKLFNNIAEHEYFVEADSTRLTQILLNLLSNAIKYNCDNGSVTLNIDIKETQRLRLSIINTGVLLTKAQVDILFTPFERLNAENTIEGTGIGLTITKNLIEEMNGEIGVESNEENGNTFWIELKISDQ